MINKKTVNTFLPGVVKPSAKKYSNKLMNEIMKTPAKNFLNVEFKYNLYNACCLSLESNKSACNSNKVLLRFN